MAPSRSGPQQAAPARPSIDLDDLRRRARESGRAPGEVTDGRTYAIALAGALFASLVVSAVALADFGGLGAWLPDLPLLYGLTIGGSVVTAIALQVRVWILGDRRMRWVADGYTFVLVLVWVSIQNTHLYQGVDPAASGQAGFPVPLESGPIGIGFSGLLSLYLLWHLAIAVMAIGATLAPSNDRLRLLTFWALFTVAVVLGAEWVAPTWFDEAGLSRTYTVSIWVLVALYLTATMLWIRGARRRPDVSRAAIAVSLVFGFFELGLQAFVGFGSSQAVDGIVLLLALSLSVPGTIEVIALGQALAARTRGEESLLLMVLSGLSNDVQAALRDDELEGVATTALAGASMRAPLVPPPMEPPTDLDIDAVLEQRRFQLAIQPIVSLATGDIAGYECLARFEGHPKPTPDVVINDAHLRGRGVELELALVESALARLADIPDDAYLSINLGVEAIVDPRALELMAGADASRLVVEVTEHLPIDDYAKVLHGLEPLRSTGVRLAIDDAGAGFASLRHVIQLRPDLLKLDRSLVAEVDRDPARRAVIAAMVDIAAKGGMDVVGEGVERPEEAATLRALGVGKAQGYLFGRPTTAAATRAAAAA